MTYETIARLLFISDHPFTRWNEVSVGEQDMWVLRAKRLLAGPGAHDYKVHELHNQIKERGHTDV